MYTKIYCINNYQVINKLHLPIEQRTFDAVETVMAWGSTLIPVKVSSGILNESCKMFSFV